MDITVRTGTTKTNGSITLSPLSFEGQQGEHAVVILQIHAHPRDAKLLEDEITNVVRHALLGSEGEAWHRLDGALKELNGLFKGFLASQAVSDIHAVIAFVDAEQSIHVSHAGRGEGYVIRSGTASQITEYVKGKPVPMFVHISSGELESGDVVVLSTQRLLRTFTSAQLAQAAASGSAELLNRLIMNLETEREMASMAIITLPVGRASPIVERQNAPARTTASSRRTPRRGESSIASTVLGLLAQGSEMAMRGATVVSKTVMKASGNKRGASVLARLKDFFGSLSSDLRHPEKKRRAHMLILALACGGFLVIWAVVQLTTLAQRSKSNAQASEVMKQIEDELRTADNKRMMGESDSASGILTRAEEQAKQIINGDSGYRSEALNLLDKIHAKQEEILNIVRVSPRVLVNVATKNSAIAAQGLIGIADGEFVVYDREKLYHVLLNTVEDGRPIGEGDTIIDGTNFDRFKSQVFLTNGSTLIEMQGGQPIVMKTEDTAGWPAAKDLKTYLRYLYFLTPDNQLLKYERLSNRYGPAVQYNVNGNIAGALDMAIDGNVYILKEKGQITKLFRGEAQPFSVRQAPDGVMANVTRFAKLPNGGNFYFLDPTKNRVLVVSDGGETGEAAYVRQYVFEGDLGTLQALYVDPDESHLYVMDSQKVYVADIVKK